MCTEGSPKINNDIALYIHIPFCRRKCAYCSFISFANQEHHLHEYTEALTREIRQRCGGSNITTVYFGGGSPSLLQEHHIAKILNSVNSLTPLHCVKEISIELNPEHVHNKKEYFQALRSMGINRISLGVQSFNENDLKVLGRAHSIVHVLQSLQHARKAGIKNINLDLIYGIPGQTLKSFENGLTRAIELQPEHLSLYALTLEENTPLYKAINDGEIPQPDSDLAADQYELAVALLEKAGYEHYEISNWAKKGYECQHNLAYWTCRPYIGVGVAAHSFINHHRTANTADLDLYLQRIQHGQPAIEMDEQITPELQEAEYIILHLRLMRGLNLTTMQKVFPQTDVGKILMIVEELSSLGLVTLYNNNLKLTLRGILLSNEVFQRFLPE